MYAWRKTRLDGKRERKREELEPLKLDRGETMSGKDDWEQRNIKKRKKRRKSHWCKQHRGRNQQRIRQIKKKRTSISRPIYCELFGFLHVFDALLAIYFYLTKASLYRYCFHFCICSLAFVLRYRFYRSSYSTRRFSFKNLTLSSKLFILSLRPYPRAHVISL